MHSTKDLNETGCTVQRLKIYSYSATRYLFGPNRAEYISFGAFKVDGYDWIVRYYPFHSDLGKDWLAFRVLPREKCKKEVKVSLRCQLIDQNGILPPYGNKCVTFVVECTISVLSPDKVTTDLAPSTLYQQLGELLHSQKGADIRFVVSGETFMAHKVILAARSPIFMAEFFGSMKESSSDVVEIKGIEPAAFKAMLHFIYTDMCPELDEQRPSDMEQEEMTALAQHLLAAADRYGLDMLKLICEDFLCSAIDVGMVATTLVLADQLSCFRLKKRCIEFIVAMPANLDAIVGTEGYNHLMASCSLLNDLLRAAMCYRR